MRDTTNRGFLLLKREEVKFYLKIAFLAGKKYKVNVNCYLSIQYLVDFYLFFITSVNLLATLSTNLFKVSFLIFAHADFVAFFFFFCNLMIFSSDFSFFCYNSP